MNLNDLARQMGIEPRAFAAFAATNKAGTDELTNEEAQAIREAWITDLFNADADMVDVEYHADGSETIHEPERNLFVNHSMCGTPGYYCPTGEHQDNPPRGPWDYV